MSSVKIVFACILKKHERLKNKSRKNWQRSSNGYDMNELVLAPPTINQISCASSNKQVRMLLIFYW